MEGPEVHAHHGHGTGHRMLDLALAGVALLVSLLSLWLALHHGETMEKLVKANSFPYVGVDAHAAEDAAAGEASFALRVRNAGVGPARVDSLRVWYETRELASIAALYQAVRPPGPIPKSDISLQAAEVTDTYLPAREEKVLFAMKLKGQPEAFAHFRKLQAGLRAQVCYCSVLDECYVAEMAATGAGRAKPVKSCDTRQRGFDENVDLLRDAR